MKGLSSRLQKLASGTNHNHRSRAACWRRFLTASALLTQIQLFWLAGFHYHPDVSDFHWAYSVADSPSSHGTPGDEARSCVFCQVARHSLSSPSANGLLSFVNISAGRIAPLVMAAPLAAPHVRLAGRDPPSSFLANH